jgi:hypothetical protein
LWTLVFCVLVVSSTAEAAERLEPGFVITRPDGATVTLEEEYILIDKSEVAKISLLVRDFERCRAAFVECNEQLAEAAPPPQKRSRWAVVLAIVAAAFAGGVVVGTTAGDEK